MVLASEDSGALVVSRSWGRSRMCVRMWCPEFSAWLSLNLGIRVTLNNGI